MTIKHYRFINGLLLMTFFLASPVMAVQLEPITPVTTVLEKPRIRSLPTTKIKYKTRKNFTKQELHKLRQAISRYPVYSEEQIMQFAPITQLLSGKSKRLRISEGDWLKTPLHLLLKMTVIYFGWFVRRCTNSKFTSR